MPVVPGSEAVVSPLVAAGLLLAAVPVLDDLGLAHPTAAEVLRATGASKTRAYELRAALEALLPTLQRAPGRPPVPAPPAVDTGAITREAYAWLRAHPGAVVSAETRQRYSDGFRHFVLELVERHPELDASSLAEAVGVPVATLQEWITAPASPEQEPKPGLPTDDVAGRHIESILEHWRRWSGGFSRFCAFVRDALHIPYGNTLIARILAVHAGRRPQRRPGRSPDEKALRDAFLTFFPGAQWTEDGSPIAVTLNAEAFTFNWELCVDAHTGALAGASVRDEEDGRAVAEAFADAVATTGAPPLALSTDNRASNFAPEVVEARGDTLHIPSTPARPQNDSPVEGAFGLFQQTAPPLRIDGETPRDLARAIAALVFTVWARAVNHRPRADRRGKSRVQLYRGEQPTDEQIAAAKAALEERRRRQEKAQATRQARLDPVVRAMLDAAFARLGLDDSTGHVKDAIARYPADAVLAAIATFDGKRTAGTLPPTVGARYLLGIARNIAESNEGLAIADALWQARLEARDLALTRLDDERRNTPGSAPELLRAFVDRAMAARGPLHSAFWLDAAANAIREAHPTLHDDLFRAAARRIHTTFAAEPRERQRAVRVLAAHVLPIG